MGRNGFKYPYRDFLHLSLWQSLSSATSKHVSWFIFWFWALVQHLGAHLTEGSGAQGAEMWKQLQVEAPHRAPNLIANCLKLNIPFLFPFNSYLMRSTTLKMRRNCNGNAKNNSYRHNFAREKYCGPCCLRDWLFFSAKNLWVVLVDGLGYGRNRQRLQTRGNWIREVWNQ